MEKLFQYPTIASLARYLDQFDINYIRTRGLLEQEDDMQLAQRVIHAKDRLKRRRIRDHG